MDIVSVISAKPAVKSAKKQHIDSCDCSGSSQRSVSTFALKASKLLFAQLIRRIFLKFLNVSSLPLERLMSQEDASGSGNRSYPFLKSGLQRI